ncbi:hypothetical protein ACWKWJ_07685 [Sphingopyxis terrae subsp. ummariensis]
MVSTALSPPRALAGWPRATHINRQQLDFYGIWQIGRHFGYFVYNIKQELEACSARVSIGVFSASLLTEEVRPKFFERLQHFEFSADHMPATVDRLPRPNERQTWLNVKPHILEKDISQRTPYATGLDFWKEVLLTSLLHGFDITQKAQATQFVANRNLADAGGVLDAARESLPDVDKKIPSSSPISSTKSLQASSRRIPEYQTSGMTQ